MSVRRLRTSGICEHVGERLLELREDRGRRPGRGHEAEPVGRVDREARLRHGRDVGQDLEALRRRERERLQLAGLQVGSPITGLRNSVLT